MVTSAGDAHIGPVLQRVRQAGLIPFVLELDRFPRDYLFSLRASGTWSGEIHDLQSGATADLSAVRSTWLRKYARFEYVSAPLAAQERAYLDAETEHFLWGMLLALDCYWISHPAALRASSWKPEQLARAARHGFPIPSTLITNRPTAAREFAQAVPQMVFKPMSGPDLGADEVAPQDRVVRPIMTTLLDEDALAELDAVAAGPCMFQAYVDKRHEFRVTIVEDRCFAAKIDSQSDARTRIDSRDMSAEIAFRAELLPPEIERRCIAYVRSYGLTFGAIDLIVDRQGRYVFLENNPTGQYLFVEELVPELQISAAVAAALINGRGRQ